MDTFCYWCNQNGRDVIAAMTYEKRPACAAHVMEFRKRDRETIPPEPMRVEMEFKALAPAINLPAVDLPPAPVPANSFDRETPDDEEGYMPTPTRRRGRKPGSKNKPQSDTPIVDVIREHNLRNRPPVASEAPPVAIKPNPKDKKVDLRPLLEIHADLLARKQRIEKLLEHLDVCLGLLGEEVSV